MATAVITAKQGIRDSFQFTGSVDPGTSSTGGGSELFQIRPAGSRTLVRGKIVNPDATHAVTLTWQFKTHDDETDWQTWADPDLPATAAANTSTAFVGVCEAMWLVRCMGYYSSGGTGTVVVTGTCADKTPSAEVSMSGTGLATSALQTSGNSSLTTIAAATASGLPAYGADAAGADAYAAVVAAPARVCHYLHVAVEDYGAIISLDGGTTDHFAIPANTERLFPGLVIPSGASIRGKNLTAGSNYTNLRVSVW